MPKVDLDIKAGYPALGREEGVFEVPADQVTETLAVNKDLLIDDEGDVDYRKTWNVTHIPTGMAMVRGLPSKKAAKAVAKILEGSGYGAITTDDPKQLAREASNLGLRDLKLWLRDQADRSRSTETFVDKLEKQARAAEPSKPLPRAAKRSEPRKKPPSRAPKKRGKKPKKPEAPPAYANLLEMARRARRG